MCGTYILIKASLMMIWQTLLYIKLNYRNFQFIALVHFFDFLFLITIHSRQTIFIPYLSLPLCACACVCVCLFKDNNRKMNQSSFTQLIASHLYRYFDGLFPASDGIDIFSIRRTIRNLYLLHLKLLMILNTVISSDILLWSGKTFVILM